MKPKYLLVLVFSIFHLFSKGQQSKYFTGKSEDSLKVMEMLNVARNIYNNQYFDSVISLSESTLERSLEIDFSRGVGESYFLKARALNRLGSWKKAIEMYGKALEFFGSLNDHNRMASTYNNWGLILKAIGRFREAIEAGENALQQVSLMPPSRLNFHILTNLGNSYQSLAQFRKATSSYFESMKVLKNEKDSIYKERMQAEVYINLGIVYYEQKLYSKSLEIYHEARSILESQQMKPQLATVYNNLGVAYTETQDFKIAEKYLQQSLELNDRLKDKLGIAICMNSFGKLYYSLDKFDDAIAAHSEAIKSFRSLNATGYLPESYLGLGKTFLKAENIKEGHLALLKGLQIALKSGQKVQELKLYEGLITLHKSFDELEMALMYYDLYSSLSQELNDQQIGRFIGQQELKEHIDKRDLALKSLQSEAALLEFQINKRNVLLILSISVIILITALFSMIYRQHQLKSMNQNFALEQKILRAQLNPHFIFNALGAIQHYMYNKTAREAARYLSKFSKLMRSILESSRTSQTTLSTELETMKYYLDLQSLRFNKPFQYTIEIDPELDPDLIQVPSLIIQPLLENAIEHGLRPKQGGWLKIEIKQLMDHIVIAVEDNGVGLENSNKVNQSNKSKQSLGNTITFERLSLINRKSKNKILFKVESRSKIEAGLCGTRASLEIPIN